MANREEPAPGPARLGNHYEGVHVHGGKAVVGDNISNINIENVEKFEGLVINSKVAAQPEYAGYYSFSSFGPVPTYVHRPALHDLIKEQLHDHLRETSPAAKILVAWGFGGAGKSQLIYRLLYGLKQASREDTVKIEDAVLAVKNWFNGRGQRWLLVFDSADNIDNKDDAQYIDLKYYLPNAPSVHIVITTRSAKAKGMTRIPSVEVGSMEPSEAVELFSTCSEYESTANRAEIETIVQELGCLALAITLAGSYVSEMHLELGQYLQEYRQRRKEILGEVPASLIHEYSESVLTTWESSFRAIRQRCVEAPSLLSLVGFIHNDDIMPELFELAKNSVQENEADEQTPHRNQPVWQLALSSQTSVDMYVIRQAFRVLESFSLVQWKKDQRTYAMHKLIHAWAYERLQQKEQGRFCVAALELLASAATDWPSDPLEKARLIPHLMANFGIISHIYRMMRSEDQAIVNLLDIVRRFLDGAGRWDEVYGVAIFQFERCRNWYGLDHSSTISAMNNLAAILGEQGQLEEAARMKTEVLEKRQRILGDDHPGTISAMNNLAGILGDQGQLEEAAGMQSEVLEKRQRILGDDHPNTISAMGNLAKTLGEQGQLEEAVDLMRRAVLGMNRVLGREHPKTRIVKANLATMEAQARPGLFARLRRRFIK